jgi:hypothetical protein
MRKAFTLGFMLALILPGAAQIAGRPANKPPSKTPNGTVQVEMKNIDYHFTSDVAAHIIHLRGKLVSTATAKIPVFDDKNSFTLDVTSAQISISTDSLARVLNRYVFAASDSPIKDLVIEAKENTLIVKGKLHQKADVPFETTAILGPNPDGRIRLHTEKIKAAHIPVKGVLDLLGLKLANLVSTKKVQGISTDGNDLILDPTLILPPPHIVGRVTAVTLQGTDILQTFGGAPEKALFADVSGNYMAYRGNVLRFGKLTMNDTDLILLDMDPQDAFDFFLDEYRDQLEAGYTKTTKDFGLRVFVRDFNKLPAARANQKPPQ